MISMSKRKTYVVTPIEQLPPTKKRLRETVYDDIIKDIQGRPKGFYKITIEGKKLKAMYPALNKRIVERKLPMKLRMRSGELFIERTG